MSERREYLTIIAILFVVIVVIAIVVGHLYRKAFLVSETSLVKYLIEHEEIAVNAAERLLTRTNNPELKRTVESYIQESQNNIVELQKFLI